MATLTPYIMSEDARAQAEFYMQALGGEILSVMTHGELPNAKEALKDKVIHLSLIAGGINLFMTDSVFAPVKRQNDVNLCLTFATEAEAHQAFAKLAEGGRVEAPLEPAFWGALFGQIADKYGVMWMITNESNVTQS